MSNSTATNNYKNPAMAVLVQDGTPCRTIITYSFSTAIHYRDVPQPTPVRTYTVTESPTQAPTPSPSPMIIKRSPSPDVVGDPSSSASSGKPQPGSSGSYPWKEVFAIQHVTTTGNCPTPTPYTHSPVPTSPSTPSIDLNAAHKVNIHLAILVGGLTVGLVVITILIAVAGCIIYTRRRRRSEALGKRLSGVDDTLTCRSTNTAGSSLTSMTERKLRCQTGWQMKQFMNEGTHSPCSPLDMYPSPSDKLEILARSGTLSDPFHDQAGHWSSPTSLAITRKLESISDACSTEAPSFFPGDDARYTLPQLHPLGSTTALTEISCAATIDSNSNSVCVNRLNCSSSLPTDSSTNTTASNINSLINHKAFVLSMMTNQTSQQPTCTEYLPPPQIAAPRPVLTAKRQSQSSQSVSESIHSDSSHESMYWINRQKSEVTPHSIHDV